MSVYTYAAEIDDAREHAADPDHPSRADLAEMEREHAAAVERARVEAYRDEPGVDCEPF